MAWLDYSNQGWGSQGGEGGAFVLDIEGKKGTNMGKLPWDCGEDGGGYGGTTGRKCNDLDLVPTRSILSPNLVPA